MDPTNNPLYRRARYTFFGGAGTAGAVCAEVPKQNGVKKTF
jgi:hypothetical protein